jgi:hypothetical protein
VTLQLGTTTGVQTGTITFSNPVDLQLIATLPVGTLDSDIVVGYIDESDTTNIRWVLLDRSAISNITALGGGQYTVSSEVTHFTSFAVLLDPLGDAGTSSTMYILTGIACGIALVLVIVGIVGKELEMRYRRHRRFASLSARVTRRRVQDSDDTTVSTNSSAVHV